MDSLYRVRNTIIYVLLWQTVSELTRVLIWYLFPELRSNEGNKHQNNPLVSAETVRHSTTYIILYVLAYFIKWRYTQKKDFWVTSEAICQWLSRVTKSRVKIIGKSHHDWPKIVIHGNECIISFLTRFLIHNSATTIDRWFRHFVFLA